MAGMMDKAKGFKMNGAYGGKQKMDKKPKLMPGGKTSGMDPHAVQDKWKDKQMKMLSKPKKKMKKGGNPLKGM